MKSLRIAAFGGFRSIPPKDGAGGADKFAVELYPRIVAKGHSLLAYSRIYPGDEGPRNDAFEGIRIKYFRTVREAGFDTLVHSAQATFDVIVHNTADVVHLQSGANSIWALLLRLAGKRVVVSQFAMDWKRDKWPWYGKLYYLISNYLTAYVPHEVAIDNLFTKDFFEKKFRRKYRFVPYGCEIKPPAKPSSILQTLGLEKDGYFLFVGRFIPDKGLHLLIPAFESIKTDKKLILVGGSPNPSEYESQILNSTSDPRIHFAGYIYGDDTNALIENAYAYVQPSLIEGLSPIILTVMGMGVPLICSDIIENRYLCGDNALTFQCGNVDSLREALQHMLDQHDEALQKAAMGQVDIRSRFNWDRITDEYIALLAGDSEHAD